MKNIKNIITRIKTWAFLNVIEAVILIIILLYIPRDPNNAWLFGYSQNRVLIVAGALVYILALLFIHRFLSSPTQNFSKSLQKIQSYPSKNSLIEIICVLCLLLLSFCIYYLFSTISFDQPLEPIHIRLLPIIIFLCVVITQVYLFLNLVRIITEGDRTTLGKVLHYASFPTIREKVFNFCDTKIAWLASKSNKTFLTFLFVFTPAIMTFALIWLIFGNTPLSHMPAGSDQIDYWHQTLTFVDHGFSGGQYSLEERTAPAEFSRFGVHGPAYPVLYGLLGRIIGWEFYSGVLINLFVITLAIYLFTRLGNLDNKQLVIGILLIGTYWPILLYLPTNMTESLNQAIAIVISALFFKQLNSRESNWKISLAIFLILLISITIRVTWSLLFFPFFLFLIFDFKGYKFWAAILLSTAGILLSFLYTKYLYAPFPFVFRFMLEGQFGIQELFSQAGIQVVRNLQNLIDEPDTHFFIQAFRYQIFAMSIFIIIKLIIRFKKETHPIKSLIRSELSFHLLNIVVPFFSVVFIFQIVDTRDYRNLAVNFLLSMLFLLLFSRYKYVYPIILINALLAFSFIPGFAQQRLPNFIYDQGMIASFSNSISDHIKFDETQSDRWCNTLGYMEKLTMPLIVVDSGIGLSEISEISTDTKSRYVLLPEEYTAESQEYIKSLGFKQLEKTNQGILFLNQNSNCE